MIPIPSIFSTKANPLSRSGMTSSTAEKICVYTGEELAKYAFGNEHPFGPKRHSAFIAGIRSRGLDRRVSLCHPVAAQQSQIEWFHDHEYIERVKTASRSGKGYLDDGDTPAFEGVYEAAATVAGSVIDALEQIISGRCRRAFVPIAGLHHARSDRAAGFCVFNDCAIAIEVLRRCYGIQRIAYVDIDAHHGDGVFYSFESDANVCFVDLHEDGRFLYPGTGSVTETGIGEAEGSKLNIPMPPGATDEQFFKVWEAAEKFVRSAKPEFIIMQCGADSLAGDPITHLQYSAAAHRHAANRLCSLADELCAGRVLGLGGGGYNLDNLSDAWCAVVEAFL